MAMPYNQRQGALGSEIFSRAIRNRQMQSMASIYAGIQGVPMATPGGYRRIAPVAPFGSSAKRAPIQGGYLPYARY